MNDERERNPEFWLGIRQGDSIVLSDRQAIEESLRRDQGADGMTYLVKSTTHVRELSSLCQWIFLELDDDQQDVRLLVKIVDQEIDLLVIFPVDGFEPGNREDMIDREEFWLFQEPEDTEDFDLTTLEYTKGIDWDAPCDDSIGDGIISTTYAQKAQGELHGQVFCYPEESGIGDQIATIIEYTTDDEVDNPELLIIEVGEVGTITIEVDEEEDAEDVDETTTESEAKGGYIEVFFGTPIRDNEVAVLTVKS